MSRNKRGQALSALSGFLMMATLLAAFAPPASAHPPSIVALEYLPDLQQLNVSIQHVVISADHYIDRVEIRKNDVLEITRDYSSQPTFDVFNYTYNISAVEGDALAATAYCNEGGNRTSFIVISTGPPPDTSSPSIRIIRPFDLEVFNVSDIVVNGTASDNVAVAKIELSLNNGTWQNATGTENWSAPVTLVPGENFIRARATDTSNNTNQDSVYVTFDNEPPPDTTPPAISIDAPSDSRVFNASSIGVSGAASDNDGVRLVEVRVNGSAWGQAAGNESWNATVDLAEGQNLIEARATDFSNNTASAFVNVTYLPPAPHVVPANARADKTSAILGDTVTVTVDLTNDGTEDSAGEVITLLSGATELANATLDVAKGGTVIPGMIVWNTTNLTAGSYALSVKVGSSDLTATAGNVTLVAPSPHVYIKSVSASPGSVVQGDAVSVTVVLRNDGTADATRVDVGIYLDNNTTPLDRSIVDVSQGNATDALATFTWNTTGAAAGLHTLVARAGTDAKSVDVYIHKPANIAITDITVSRINLEDQPKDSTQKVTLTVRLSNSGESTGIVLLVVKEKDRVLFSGNATVVGGTNITKEVSWPVKGAGRHVATATISGDGTDTKATVVHLSYKSPGYEAAAILAAIGAAGILLGRKRRRG